MLVVISDILCCVLIIVGGIFSYQTVEQNWLLKKQNELLKGCKGEDNERN